MRFSVGRFARGLAFLPSLVSGSWTSAAVAQDLPRVSGTRGVIVGGIASDPHVEDVLGLSRLKFQGLIASELATVGYAVVDPGATPKPDATHPPLTLIGTVKEEICDDQEPRQCRVAIQWELQDARGVVVYRTTTRAVDQASTFDKKRRSLVLGALTSLLQRRRFALQFGGSEPRETPAPSSPLGFKRCQRGPSEMPDATRALASGLVFVESGSNLAIGTIVSPDGFILTSALAIADQAPLHVRFSGKQSLPARIVAVDKASGVALLHVAAHTETTCLALRDTPLAAGQAVYGVSSDTNEDRAISLIGSVVQKTQGSQNASSVVVDHRIARGNGGPLLDDRGRLAAIVSGAEASPETAAVAARELYGVLRALQVKPAAITDPRLSETEDAIASGGFVRDADDPPFVLGKRYTYGTSPAARSLRTSGFVTAGVGAATIAASWIAFRVTVRPSPAAHDRSVIANDIGWVLLGLGAVGIGVSYALPDAHDVVAANLQTAQRRSLSIALSSGGLMLGARL